MNQSKTLIDSEEGVFKRLITGKFGLVDTFWGVYFAVSILFNIVLNAIEDINTLIALNILNSSYLIFACICVWKAANLFQGKKYWSILAKVIVLISLISNIIIVISMIIYFFTH
ncbi:hypothetical protein BM607_008765 [Shewanella sp. SACH]|uniref:Uncharacterized protein n=1 Tax=Shewanella baltica (strain OS195) TaxID=399599 RepID=A9L0W9_SHEB9|nr:conserved hypothetical protein [Shewanella baltica OS195]ADT92890.1 hypothetical protein Sbal678_0706 [Shewanella baltica OS678]AEG10028.1 hypothetical protein Sbal175_0745 [Shewanella baltica BA175]EHC06024.1 hypothetical protein Sbal625DRAFT_2615 [Shewanella baltica OS625]EHQ16443.1 hypothetical protein Sbal183_3563 [Shewanella baltica OS183]OUS51343.1 hypothetical protein BM607_008765 [Shewanella sp. SACH]